MFHCLNSFHFCFALFLQQLYARLSELLGLHDHLLILNIIVGKIATNLKCYAEVSFPSPPSPPPTTHTCAPQLNDSLLRVNAYFSLLAE